MNKRELIERSLEEYKKDSVILEFAGQSSIQEAEGYDNRELGFNRIRPIKPRIVEVIELVQKLKLKRLGLAFCSGLRKEAKVVQQIFSRNNFEVVSVICKAGRIPKEDIGLRDDQKIVPGCFQAMCHPFMQALILNNSKTELNVLIGLCVGHDSLFLKYSDAFCTVLAAKDRVLGHNPLAAIYNIDSYYRSLI